MDAIDDDIDRLYQLGLDVFVAERNALAKRAKRPDVKALEKPSVPAWVVNQLYWRDRVRLGRLVAASEALRFAHHAMLSGGGADVRAAESAHRDALREAMTAARQVLTGAGLPASPSTLEAVSRTLEALPHPEANGRLVRPLTPAGLEALAGLTMAVPAAAIRLVEPRDKTPGRGARDAEVPTPTAPTTRTDASVDRAASENLARASSERDARQREAREREVREREAREQEARKREARQREADEAVRIASDAYRRAQAAVAEAEAVLSARRAERDRAAAAYEHASRAARDLL